MIEYSIMQCRILFNGDWIWQWIFFAEKKYYQQFTVQNKTARFIECSSPNNQKHDLEFESRKKGGGRPRPDPTECPIILFDILVVVVEVSEPLEVILFCFGISTHSVSFVGWELSWNEQSHLAWHLVAVLAHSWTPPTLANSVAQLRWRRPTSWI